VASTPLATRRTRRRITVAEYMAMPDDGHKYELVHGELVMSPSYFFAHGRVAGYIFAKLDAFVSRRRLGVVGIDTDVVFAEHEVRRPDINFISARRRAIIRGHVYGPPDLAVEVTSPSNWQDDLHDKRDDYERFGVREYWVIDISDGRNRAFQFVLRGRLYHGGLVEGPGIRSHVLKGFALRLTPVWERAAEA
jgi:Uma2 family endonuclease